MAKTNKFLILFLGNRQTPPQGASAVGANEAPFLAHHGLLRTTKTHNIIPPGPPPTRSGGEGGHAAAPLPWPPQSLTLAGQRQHLSTDISIGSRGPRH
jgi:hypothetical protein